MILPAASGPIPSWQVKREVNRMISWLRKLGPSAVALTLALAITGCDDGGGRAFFNFFFGINGFDDCDRVVVEIDLDAVGAVIAEDGNGDLMCFLNAVLDGSGCEVDWDVDGGVFTATIDNCTISAVSALFRCRFSAGTLSAIRSVTTAECDCDHPKCDDDPDVCVGTSSDPTACEDCSDGIDNDHDGDTDCDDPACQDDPACGTSLTTLTTRTTATVTVTDTTVTITDTTTSTTTTTTNTTTTVTHTTTSTTTSTSNTLPPTETYTITFSIDVTIESVGAVQFDVDYSNAPGSFVDNAGEPACAALPVVAGFGAFNDNTGSAVLTGGVISFAGFNTPAAIATCDFDAIAQPVPGDFSVTTTDASFSSTLPIDPFPDVSVGVSGP